MLFKKNNLIFIFTIFFLFFCVSNAGASSLANRLSGKIILQVEKNGEAYYVNPLDLKAYYLGRPNDAFNVMRSFGLGVSNADLLNFIKKGARKDLSGRILLQVEDKGQAYYINPDNLRLYYLGRPADAFVVMRYLGLGISNSDLSKMSLTSLGGTYIPDDPVIIGPGEKLVTFSWKYKAKNYRLEKVFSNALYYSYRDTDKSFYYYIDNPPADLRNSYYNIFLTLKPDDKSIKEIIASLREISKNEDWNEDEFLEFVMALVQYIPYDFSKSENSPQNFPYESLYKNSGICSDKVFLALLFIRELGYGGAIFDYHGIRHSAVAVECSAYSSYNSGYCFVETTNYFPVGVFPSSLSSGQASTNNISWDKIFVGDHFGEVEIFQKSFGKKYNRISNIVSTVNTLSKMESSIAQKRIELDTISAQLIVLKKELDDLLIDIDNYNKQRDTVNYNLAVDSYNLKAQNYNNALENYSLKLNIYNNDISLYNRMIRSFYQN